MKEEGSQLHNKQSNSFLPHTAQGAQQHELLILWHDMSTTFAMWCRGRHPWEWASTSHARPGIGAHPMLTNLIIRNICLLTWAQAHLWMCSLIADVTMNPFNFKRTTRDTSLKLMPVNYNTSKHIIYNLPSNLQNNVPSTWMQFVWYWTYNWKTNSTIAVTKQ